MKVFVTDHALDRGLERFLSPVERALNLNDTMKKLWASGTLRRWVDPDDPRGAHTVTAEIEPHWSSDVQEPRYLVGRDQGDRLVILSALTKEQYEHNVKCRWRPR